MYLLDTEDNHELTLIHQKHEKNSIDKCKDLLDLWMKRTSEPKWEQVVQALRKVNLNHLATELKTALEQPGQEGKKGKHISTFLLILFIPVPKNQLYQYSFFPKAIKHGIVCHLKQY